MPLNTIDLSFAPVLSASFVANQFHMMSLRADISDKVRGNWRVLSLYIVFVFVVLFALQTVHAWYRLRQFKGPVLARFSKIWLIRTVMGGKMHLAFAEACDKYGSLARIGPNDLVTNDPALMRRMLAVRSPYRRSDWYFGMRFDPTRDNVESQMDEEKHSALRLKMSAGYSGKENENLERSIDRNVQAFINLISTKYVTTNLEYKPLDFGRKTQYFTLDVISDVAYGESFGFLATDSDVHEYIKTTEQVIPAAMMVTVFPWLNKLLKSPLMKGLMPSEKDPIGFGKIIGITKQVVGERFGPNAKDQRDMLGSFVRHGLRKEEAESETVLQVIAGSDTTAGAIRSTFLYIITIPRVYAKLLTEISSATISSPIKDSEAKKMPYLQAVVKEGLRIWPPVAGLMSKEVPASGDIVNGVFVPGGTKIGYCAWGIFRNKKIWGEDANMFRPERWLEGPAAKIKEQELILELVFAAGRFQCLGKNVALMELNKIFVELLRNFEFSIVDPSVPWKSYCMGIFMQSEMWLVVTKRDSQRMAIN